MLNINQTSLSNINIINIIIQGRGLGRHRQTSTSRQNWGL